MSKLESIIENKVGQAVTHIEKLESQLAAANERNDNLRHALKQVNIQAADIKSELPKLRQGIEDLMRERDATQARAAELIKAAQGLVEYRNRAGALDFQLEKADDYIHMIEAALAVLDMKGDK